MQQPVLTIENVNLHMAGTNNPCSASFCMQQHFQVTRTLCSTRHLYVNLLFCLHFCDKIALCAVCCVQGRRREGSETAVFYVSFISGFVAGSFAAFCVTPLDGKFIFCVWYIQKL